MAITSFGTCDNQSCATGYLKRIGEENTYGEQEGRVLAEGTVVEDQEELGTFSSGILGLDTMGISSREVPHISRRLWDHQSA